MHVKKIEKKLENLFIIICNNQKAVIKNNIKRPKKDFY